ncbi:MAG TPA: BTAD domain-containing putative transcriptional regulator [Micromonospora sp.]|nr:BTAD domain-containing putative transcriptional regulator [Micromonospora sp.]
MRFGVLGPLTIQVDGVPKPVGPPKQRALLAALLVSPGHTLSARILVDELWPEQAPATAGAALQVYIAGLRKTLGEQLRTLETGYLLAATPDEVDAGQFEALLSQARAVRDHDPATAARLLGSALALWRGSPFDGVSAGPRVTAAATRLAELHLAAREAFAELQLTLGHHREIVADLSAWVLEHPLAEHLVVSLMLALHRSGRSVEAIDAYDKLRVRQQQAGGGPSPDGPAALLAAAIARRDPTLDEVHPHLPAAANRFIGRRRELDRAARLLGGCRILTIVGTGGSGKTRLAIELARELAAEYPDGVRLVELAGHPPASSDDAATALTAGLAAALRVRETAGQSTFDALVATLGQRRMLLLVDNCEHVRAAVVPALTQLIAACPRIRVVATSREPLGLDAETVLPVGGLDIGATGDPTRARFSDAVRLLADRLGRARGGTPLDAEEENLAVELCRRLDGLPLAIELAAARLRSLTLPDVLARLDRRLDLLAGRSPVARHRTMRAAIDWSYDQLHPTEQTLLQRLSVFVGDFRLAAAETVGADPDRDRPREPADVLDLLIRLVDRSLVSRHTGGEHPYRLIETIQEYARDKLGHEEEYAAARRRHAEWHAQLVAAAPPMEGPAHAAWLEQTRRQYDNIRAALAWTLSDGKDPQLGLAIATDMWWYWWVAGQMGEGLAWLNQALAATSAEPSAPRGRALRAAAALARNSGDLRQARSLGEQALQTLRDIGDNPGVLTALNNLCITAQGEQDYAASLAYGREAILLAEQYGPQRLLAAVLNNTAGTLRCLDRLDEATDMFERGLELFRGLADRRGEAAALTNLAVVARRRNEWAEARRLGRKFLSLYRELGIVEGQLDGVEALAHVAAVAGNHAEALRLLLVAARERQRLGAPLFTPDEIAERDRAEALARAGLNTADTETVAARAARDDFTGIVASLLAGSS